MGNMKFFENMINNRIKGLHTAYIAKVLSVSGDTAKIQPLGMSKAYGETAQTQAPLSNVPILKSAKYKINSVTTKEVITSASISKETKDMKDENDETVKVVTNVELNTSKTSISIPSITQIKKGDLVLCVCCERNITDAKNGKNSVPVVGSHSMSDSVIVSCL